VEPIISSCPACRNNFRSFFCHFTCSPTQGSFVNITATQKTNTGETAVKELDFYTSQRFAEGFFDSCKSVQVGSANSWAMDLIGGGAKDYKGFLKFLGDEKDLGSPFQINYPSYTPPQLNAFNATPRSCTDNDLSSRCTCIDCPDVCLPLPEIPAPGSEPTCHVGMVSCLTFVLTLGYALAVAAFFAAYVFQLTIRRRKESSYDGITLTHDQGSSIDTPLSPRTHARNLVGASSLAQSSGVDGDDSIGTARSESRHLGRGASLLDPLETIQPRQHRLNTFLRRTFYRLGLSCASYPWLTFAMIFTIVGLLNIGWKDFSVETDPVRLWVAPNSESRLQKEYFDEHFGPFYRPEQMFITTIPEANSDGAMVKPPVLSWDHLNYWLAVESDIRTLRSYPNNYSLDDVCFKPTDTACVVQSALAWFDNDLSLYDEDTWKDQLLKCANSPVDCLPEFGQPLAPQYVLGKVPDKEREEGMELKKDYLAAEAMVVTYVVSNSLDPELQGRAMEWETALRRYMEGAQEQARENGLEVAWSTGVSLEEEIGKSSNTDVRIVVLSYVAMFFYVAFTLGANSGQQEDGVFASLERWARNFPKLFRGSSVTSSVVDSDDTPTLLPRLPRGLFVNSKFTLGLFGIALVILSVSSSVGFFSLAGVKTTLIIAEVIPFLVLAVGVDNVFILVHELDRQNLLHGPNASALGSGVPAMPGSPTVPMSPTQPFATYGGRRAMVEPSTDDTIDAQSTPLFLSSEERIARAVAKMGPSILLSTITETVAFALGALVPMPAVRNFALYAAGSVLLNALLQVTVFVSALTLDLRRVEVNYSRYRLQGWLCSWLLFLLLGESRGLFPLHPASSENRAIRRAAYRKRPWTNRKVH
jgi:Niemann-Pick C1 protein